MILNKIIIGIYKITNKVNRKLYIGESIDIEKRWDKHINDLNENTHHSNKLQKDWNIYGKDNFSFQIIEEIKSLESYYKTKMQLIYLESKYIYKYDAINCGYNIQDTVQEILDGNKILWNKANDIFYLKNLIKYNGKYKKDVIEKKEYNGKSVSTIVDELREEYKTKFSKGEFYLILESKNIIKKFNKSYHVNEEFINKGYFNNGKSSKNNSGFKYYQILITDIGKQFIIDLLSLDK